MSDIKVKVSSDTSQFQRGVSQMERSLNGLKNIAAAIGGGMAFSAAANMLGKASSVVVSLAKESSKAAMEMDAMKISLQQLVGNGDKANKLLKDIQDFGAKTPLQTKDLNEAAKTLLNFGISADKIMPVLKNLGDVSLGDAEKLQRLARVFGQVSSAGRLQLEDVNQLIDAGFSPLQVIADNTTNTVEDMRDTISKGGMDISDLALAFELAAGQGGKLNGALEKMADTPAGALSNLQDMVEQLKIAFGTGMNTGLKDFFNKAAGFGSSMKSTVTMLGEAAGGLISEVSKVLPATLTELTQAVKAKGNIWSFLAEVIGRAFEAAINNDKVKKAVMDLGSMFREGIIPESLRELYNTSKKAFSGDTGVVAGTLMGGGYVTGGPVGNILKGAGLMLGGYNAKDAGNKSSMDEMFMSIGSAITAIGVGKLLKGKDIAKAVAETPLRERIASTVFGSKILQGVTKHPVIAGLLGLHAGITASGVAAGEGVTGGYKSIAKAVPLLGTGYSPGFKAGKWGGKTDAEMALEKINKEQEKYIFSDFARKVYEGKSGIIKKFETPASTPLQTSLTDLFKGKDRYKEFQSKTGFWRQFAPDWALFENAKAPWDFDPEKGMGAKITRSLTKVGGGGAMFSGGVINLQREANKILTKIENNTKNLSPSWN